MEETVRPWAAQVDAGGEFPTASMDALARAGFLGLTVAEPFGSGGGLADAARVIQTLASTCGSTAMVMLMHYSAVAVLDRRGSEAVREAMGAGEHLTTLAFSEAGSRSQFWVPMGTATWSGERVRLDGQKSWVTAATEADSYVWSSRPLQAEGPMTLWHVASDTPGLSGPGDFDGFGLRGNHSAPVTAEAVEVSTDCMLGPDGAGLDIAMTDVLPWFLVLNGAFSVGLMESVTEEAGSHLRSTRFEHLDRSLAEVQITRMDHARMRIATDQAAALLEDTVAALEGGRDDAMLRVLEIKAAAGEAAASVTDLAMKVCGGAAYRKELGIERRFRDARAARVMAPTTDALLDFVGRAIHGMPLL
ncbi:MAG: acyl-CoA/acyl-ACP dehydrogenase [Acidimicrobiales bacterium]|nr:acyl-CoA/acyl-ACP dehydrogenase [Acidimicrobiales bacterium]